MRRFLYYFPGVGGMNPEMLAARGLLGRFRRFGGGLIEHGVTQVFEGMPDKGSGCVVAASGEPLAYDAGKYRWLQAQGWWVGVDKDFPPGPADLVREVLIGGADVVLAEQLWRAPRLWRWDADKVTHVPNLPTVMTPSVAGGRTHVKIDIAPAYAEADQLAARTFAAFVEGRTISLEELLTDAVAALAVNYRIGPEEAGLLGLLNEPGALAVLKTAVDLDSFQEHARALAATGVEFIEPEDM